MSVLLHIRYNSLTPRISYGWDWGAYSLDLYNWLLTAGIGPVLMTAGPWRPIYLHTYQSRITDLRASSSVGSDLDADLDVSISVATDVASLAEVILKSPSGSVVVGQKQIKLGTSPVRARFHFAKGEVDLWYPIGYGKQPIYQVQVNITDEVRVNGEPTASCN